jgi:serine/threonine-protein kinase
MPRRLTILRQVCEALHYIHSQGVVHRDVKPENVLVAENSAVKLIDFSISQTKWDRVIGVFGRKASGSPSYMPPEQIQGRRTDYRSDYYSLGILAFELLTGRLPFTGPSMQVVFDKHMKEPTPSARAGNTTVPLEIDQVIDTLMQKNPTRRPSRLDDIIYVIGKCEMRNKDTKRLLERAKDKESPSG